MYPIALEVGSVVLPSWHLMFFMGAIAAFYFLLIAARKNDSTIPSTWLSELFCIAYISGYFGARIFSIFVDEPEVRGALGILGAMFRLGPMTFYGGALSAFFFGCLYARWRRLSISSLADLCIPAGLIGLSLGRVGCFLNGDDYGLPVAYDLSEAPPWWSVVFPVLQDGVSRYPVQIFESIYAALFAIGLLLLLPKLRRRFGIGVAAALGVGGYSVFRFFIEYWRADERSWVVRNVLSPAQFISVLLITLLTVIFLARARTYARQT